MKVRLTRPPDSFDEAGVPCYSTDQDKGLFENQDHVLLEKAMEDGYSWVVKSHLFGFVRSSARRLHFEGGLSIVELGGGDGSLFETLKPYAKLYFNVDPGACRDKASVHQDASYARIRCSAEDVPLPDGCADLAVSVAALDHVPDYRRAIDEAKRLLKPGGTFLVVLNNRRSWWKALLSRTAYLKRREMMIARAHYFQWSPEDGERELRRKFSDVQVSSTTFVPYIARIGKHLLGPANSLGSLLMPRRGANLLMTCTRD